MRNPAWANVDRIGSGGTIQLGLTTLSVVWPSWPSWSEYYFTILPGPGERTNPSKSRRTGDRPGDTPLPVL